MPNTYTLSDRNYDYSELESAYNKSVNNFLDGIKRGKSERENFLQAGQNILEGIKSSNLSFTNGRFYDKTGKLTNLGKGNRDYNGIMAYYIYDLMQKQTPQKEESISARLLKNAGLNRDYFLTLDKDDLTQTTNRRAKLASYLRNNLDSYKGISGIEDLISKLENNSNDYIYELGRVFPDINWIELFGTQRQSTPAQHADQQQTANTPQQEVWKPNEQAFNFSGQKPLGESIKQYYYNTIHNLPTNTIYIALERYLKNPYDELNKYKELFGNKYSPDLTNDYIIGLLTKELSSRPDELTKIGENRYRSKDGKYVFEIGQDRKSGKIYTYDDLDKMNKWLTESGSVAIDLPKKQEQTNPQQVDPQTLSSQGFSLKDQVQNYFGKVPNLEHQYQYQHPYFVSYKKQGGVAKLQYGGLTPYNYTVNDSQYDTSRLYNPTILLDNNLTIDKLSNYSPWISDKAQHNNGLYGYTDYSGNISDIQNNPYYKQFTQDLVDKQGLSNLGESFVRLYNQLTNNNDVNFKGYKSIWAVNGENAIGEQGQSTYNPASRILRIRTDNIAGPGHNIFLRKGDRYFYNDNNNQRVYVSKPENLSDYAVSGPTQQIENNIIWTDYQLYPTIIGSDNPVQTQSAPVTTPVVETPQTETPVQTDDNTIQTRGIETPTEATPAATPVAETRSVGETPTTKTTVADTRSSGSDLYTKKPGLTWKEKHPNAKSNALGFVTGLTEAVPDIARLLLSLRTNRKNYNTLRDSLQPVLQDTYERYSPVTGDFATLQHFNNQSADLMREAGRQTTSDASLQLAKELESARQARDIQTKGFLTDNAEIRRTQAEALARQEDNMARRSQVANANRAEIQNIKRQKAQLLATRRMLDWQSKDNFMASMAVGLQNKLSQLRAINQDNLQQQYSTDISTLDQLYKQKHPNATLSEMINDPEYINAARQLRNRLSYDLGRTIFNPWRVRYQVPNNPDTILQSMK